MEEQPVHRTALHSKCNSRLAVMENLLLKLLPEVRVIIPRIDIRPALSTSGQLAETTTGCKLYELPTSKLCSINGIVSTPSLATLDIRDDDSKKASFLFRLGLSSTDSAKKISESIKISNIKYRLRQKIVPASGNNFTRTDGSKPKRGKLQKPTQKYSRKGKSNQDVYKSKSTPKVNSTTIGHRKPAAGNSCGKKKPIQNASKSKYFKTKAYEMNDRYSWRPRAIGIDAKVSPVVELKDFAHFHADTLAENKKSLRPGGSGQRKTNVKNDSGFQQKPEAQRKYKNRGRSPVVELYDIQPLLDAGITYHYM